MSKQRVYMASDANWVEHGQVVSERFQYEPYGQVAVADEGHQHAEADAGGWAWSCEHHGMPQDEASALYHFRNRDDGPSLGRWVQQGPMGYVDGMSLYEYAASAPQRYVDPLGTTIEVPCAWDVQDILEENAVTGYNRVVQKDGVVLYSGNAEFGGSLLSEIFAKMIASKRKFSFLRGDARFQLLSHADTRISIIRRAASASFEFGTLNTPNLAQLSVLGVVRSPWSNPSQWQMGCALGLMFATVAGIADTSIDAINQSTGVGAVGGSIQGVNAVIRAFNGLVHQSFVPDRDDWVPGDGGTIKNNNWTPGDDVAYQSLNILYMGGTEWWAHGLGEPAALDDLLQMVGEDPEWRFGRDDLHFATLNAARGSPKVGVSAITP